MNKATSREAIFEPESLIWTSGGRIPASHLVNLECRWMGDDEDIFQIKVNGIWVIAQSQDFLFND